MSHSMASARVVMGAVLVMVMTSFALPAMAHSQLVSSSPLDGAVLAETPREVSFTFNEDLISAGSSIAVSDAEGNVRASALVDSNGPTVRMPWPVGLPAGVYQVAYRVVSGDGHPVSGAISVTLAAGSAPPSTAPLTGSSDAESAVPAPPAADPGSRATGTWPMEIVVLASVLVLSAVAWFIARWRRGRASAVHNDPEYR